MQRGSLREAGGEAGGSARGRARGHVQHCTTGVTRVASCACRPGALIVLATNGLSNKERYVELLNIAIFASNAVGEQPSADAAANGHPVHFLPR